MAWLEQPTSMRRLRVRTSLFERPASESDHPYQRRQQQVRLLRRLLWVVLIVGAIVGLAVVVYVRASNAYEQGKTALAAHRYYEAIDHFAAARLLVIPYKNADALTSEAEAALKGLAAAAASQAAAQRLAALTTPIETALAAGRYHEAADALRAARAAQRTFVFKPDARSTPLVTLAVTQLLSAAHKAFALHTWSVALADSRDVLVFEPGNGGAKSLRDAAARAHRAAPAYAQAVAAAAKKNWQTVVRMAKRTLTIDPAYPGAPVLLARAQRALAPAPASTASPAPVQTTAPAPAPVRTVAPPPPPPP
jgi:hypothetical protein